MQILVSKRKSLNGGLQVFPLFGSFDVLLFEQPLLERESSSANYIRYLISVMVSSMR